MLIVAGVFLIGQIISIRKVLRGNQNVLGKLDMNLAILFKTVSRRQIVYP